MRHHLHQSSIVPTAPVKTWRRTMSASSAYGVRCTTFRGGAALPRCVVPRAGGCVLAGQRGVSRPRCMALYWQAVRPAAGYATSLVRRSLRSQEHQTPDGRPIRILFCSSAFATCSPLRNVLRRIERARAATVSLSATRYHSVRRECHGAMRTFVEGPYQQRQRWPPLAWSTASLLWGCGPDGHYNSAVTQPISCLNETAGRLTTGLASAGLRSSVPRLRDGCGPV